MRIPQKQILLNISFPLADKVDQAAFHLGINRTRFLRLSILRNLSYFSKNELPLILKRQNEFEPSDLSGWTQSQHLFD